MHNQGWDCTPHRRLNLLTGEWILVSPHRSKRPWSGQKEDPDKSTISRYDPDCYLCPKNSRAEGVVNPDYTSTFVFQNDFAALLPEHLAVTDSDFNDHLLRAEPESGICRVICYTPRHDLTMARMEHCQIEQIIRTWQEEYNTLGALDSINHVQIFENRGSLMGCSNVHPHGQIWANSTIPTIPAAESFQQQEYMQKSDSCLLCSYLARELEEDQRILFSNQSFVALVPFWATWPFETMILPRRHLSSIELMTSMETADLAEIMHRLAICYDNLFQTSFPYSMGIHQRPLDGCNSDYWHYHIHYLPPLLRSQSVKKHMVGYELLAMPQRDITAEIAAKQLQRQSTVHYLEVDEK